MMHDGPPRFEIRRCLGHMMALLTRSSCETIGSRVYILHAAIHQMRADAGCMLLSLSEATRDGIENRSRAS